MPRKYSETGVTLIELMIVIVITAILLALAVPAFQDTIDRNRLKSATDTLFGELQFAKSEAIKRNQVVRVILDNSTSTETIDGVSTAVNWCYGVTDQANCGCKPSTYSTPNQCTIEGVRRDNNSSTYPGVTLTTTNSNFGFDNVRGTVGPGTITLNSARGKQSKIVVSRMGRILICSPSGSSNVPGYTTPCP